MKKFMGSILRKSEKLVIFIMMFVVMTLSACQSQAYITSKDIPKENKISTPTDRIIYTNEELEEESSMIVKAEVMDELSSENSLTDFSKEYGMVVRFCAVRSVHILDVYKDDSKLSVGDKLQIQEDSAIYEADGEYFMETMDDVLPLQKGQTYLLYLDDGSDTMSGKPAIMSYKKVRD